MCGELGVGYGNVEKGYTSKLTLVSTDCDNEKRVDTCTKNWQNWPYL